MKIDDKYCRKMLIPELSILPQKAGRYNLKTLPRIPCGRHAKIPEDLQAMICVPSTRP
ncbi:MAG: hypothetical protein ACOC4M_17495 [Promethearchaeia archaeon]